MQKRGKKFSILPRSRLLMRWTILFLKWAPS